MNRALLATAAIVVTAALIAPLGMAAKPPDKNPNNPNLSIQADPNPVRIGKTVTISGKLRGSDNSGKSIELQSDEFPFNGKFKPEGAAATTDANGDYSFQVTPDRHTQYRSVAELNPNPDETSQALTVRVRMRITRLVDDTTPARGQTVTFSGVVTPEHDGLTVFIQRRRPTGTWKTMATSTLQQAPGDESSYSQDVEIRRDGVWRTKVKADADHLGNHSRRIRLDVP